MESFNGIVYTFFDIFVIVQENDNCDLMSRRLHALQKTRRPLADEICTTHLQHLYTVCRKLTTRQPMKNSFFRILHLQHVWQLCALCHRIILIY